jgi:flagellar hook-associated protein 2
MGTFSVGGLSTGLDTKSIIDQLLAIDGRPKVKLEWNKALWESRRTAWSDLNSKLLSLGTQATGLMSGATWQVFSGITSSDATKVTGSATGTKPASGSYDIEITQLAATERWSAGASLGGPTAGVRTSGTWYRVGPAAALGTTLLTALRDQTNTSVGLNNGSTITMAWSQDGQNLSSTFNVTATSTVDDLASWAQSQVPGSTINFGGGQLSITSPPGEDGEITSLSFTARNAAGTVLNRFNGSQGASTSMTTAASDGGAATNDTLQIVQGSNTWYVNIAQSDNEFDIANKINAVSGIGVTASVNAGLLQLDSKSSGAGGSFTVTSSGGLVGALGLAESTAGQDSNFTVNGTAYTRATNTGITDVLNDVSLDLVGLTAGPVTLDVGPASATVADQKKKILDFVNQYNSVIDYVKGKIDEKKVVNPKNLTEYLQGPLSRDFRFSSVGFDLRHNMTDLVQGLPAGAQMLSDIGIATTDSSGKLTVDESKLEAMLNTDPTKVRDIFTQAGATLGDQGIARRVNTLVSNWRTGGTVDSSLQGASRQIDSLQDSIDRFSDRLERRRAYYDRMFASLEGTIGKMQQQNSWMSGQFSMLSSGSMFG